MAKIEFDCRTCGMPVGSSPVYNYQIFKGWSAGCDTHGCPGELDEKKVYKKKQDAIKDSQKTKS